MTQIYKITLLLAVALLMHTSISFAQSNATKMEVFLKPIDPIAVKDQSNPGATPYNVVFAISISGTSGITKFHVKLGDTPGGSEKAAYVIPFDPQGSLPSGITYSRKGNIVYIGMGVHTDMADTHAQVQTEDINGNRSGAVKPMN